MSGPLSKYRIIDLTAMVSGPYATQLLGDQGADVIKVETHIGDLTRWAGPSRGGISSAFLLNNRSKRSIALDLKQDDGKLILNALIDTADVFVQNFRPGAVERMGFGENHVRAIKPDIIYVSISGFGESGPYTHKRVYDHVIQALSGVMHVQRDNHDTPRLMHTILPDKLTAVTTAQAITAALLGRENTGKGEHVRLSMMDTTVAWMWPDMMINYTLMGDDVTNLFPAGTNDTAFETRDGYMIVLVISDDEWQGFVRASGRPELGEDERFKTLPDRIQHFAEMFDTMRATVRDGTTAEWVEKLDAEQVPCAQVNSVEAVFTDPQVMDNELIEETEHPNAGPMRAPRVAARFREHSIPELRPAPMLGQHNVEILTELGIDDIEGLREASVIT